MSNDRTKYACEVIRPEFAGDALGVPGRFTNLVRHAVDQPNQRIRNQKFVSEWREYKDGGSRTRARVTIRHDDEHLNGHPTFSITGETQENRNGWREDSFGCIHDVIGRVFPELAGLIQWHLVSTDAPMHYVSNTLYLAGDRDCWGRAPGEPSKFEYHVYFGDSPIPHKVGQGFWDWLAEKSCDDDFEWIVDKVAETREGREYAGFRFVGYRDSDVKWHTCPFKTSAEAASWAEAMTSVQVRFDRVAVEWSKGKPRDLDAARRCAVWPEATDEQLMAPPAILRETLEARLPGLLDDFRAAVESIGFEFV